MENKIVLKPRDFLPKQKEVFDLIEEGFRYIMYSGAYGAGKTLLTCNIVIQECLKYPGSIWFFGAQTVPNLRDTVVRTFLEEIDLHQDELNKLRKKAPAKLKKALSFQICNKYYPSTMTFKFFNGSEVLFRSCDEPSKLKSLNLDGVAIDEPVDIDEDIFLMLQGRLRGTHTNRRIAVMAGNPAGFMNWVYQRFFEKPGEDYAVVETTTYDNTFLPGEYIPTMEESYDEDYKRRYLYGKWGSFSGQIFKDFSYENHVGDFRDKECSYHIAGFDDGTRNPACILAIGIDNDNNIYIKNEFYQTGLVDAEKVNEICNMNMKYKFTKIYPDTAALSMIEAMRNEHLRIGDTNKDVDMGISKLKSFFKNDLIFIDSRCVNLIKEIESYRYDKDRNNKNLTEQPVKKNDHAIDALRYAVTDFNPFHKEILCKGGKW